MLLLPLVASGAHARAPLKESILTTRSQVSRTLALLRRVSGAMLVPLTTLPVHASTIRPLLAGSTVLIAI